MAYQTQNITTLAAILGHVGTFAAAQGWTVTAGSTYQHPSLGGAIAVVLSVSGSEVLFTPSEGGAPVAKITTPILQSGAQTPTKLHMFISQTPQPYIALCVEFGFNTYRHLYFGYMEKVGAYAGGEVVGASNHESEFYDFSRSQYYSKKHQFLFRGHCNRWPAGNCGGVRVSHVNNTNLWRKFDESLSPLNEASDFRDTKAFGGFGDGVNDPMVAHGQSPFLGANILTPVDLYAPRFPGSNTHMVPIGRPAGIRLVNMKDLEPGAQINVGGINWRVFAAHSKQAYIEPIYLGGNYPIAETSAYVGYAYPES